MLKKNAPTSSNVDFMAINDLYNKECEIEQNLKNDLLQKEMRLLKLKKMNREADKGCKSIEQSRVWKLMSPFWKFVDFRKKVLQLIPFYRRISELDENNKKLLTEKQLLESQLKSHKENDPQSRYQSLHAIKAAKENGDIMNSIGEIQKSKADFEFHHLSALKYAARLYQNEKPEMKYLIYNKILSGIRLDELPEFIAREGLEENLVKLNSMSSFKTGLTLQLMKNQMADQPLPAWILDEKIKGYQFIDTLGIKRPWVSSKTYNYLNIPHQQGVAIKPANGAGSRGVYLIFDFHNIHDVRRGRIISNWNEFEASMKNDLERGWVSHDNWMMEELISYSENQYAPPRDLKFYCFYGRVELVLEVERYPELKYCWWTAEGKRISTGKYDNELFTGNGFTNAEHDLASQISQEIPSPFIRIDFLKTKSEFYFGEFTPKPGNYDEFNHTTDKWLGECFLQAENRLLRDMIAGKDFKLYKSLLK